MRVRPRLHLRHPELVRFAKTLALGCIAIMILSGLPTLAQATSPGPPMRPNSLPSVLGFHATPSTTTVGTTVNFFANVTGGEVFGSNTGNELNYNGYHIYWFFGESNSTGDINEVTQNIAANSTCTNGGSPQRLCTNDTAISESTTYTQPGTYDVSITVYDANLNYTIATTNVTVLEPGMGVTITEPCYSSQAPGATCLRPDNSVTFPRFLINTDINFNAEAYDITGSFNLQDIVYTWNFGDGNTSYGNEPQHAFALNGTYVVSVTATDSDTGDSARAFLNLTVSLLPITMACGGWSGPAQVGVPETFNANPGDPNPHDLANLSFVWNFGDGTDAEGRNVTHVYTTAGTYTPNVQIYTAKHDLADVIAADCAPTLNITGSITAKSGAKGVTAPVGQLALLNVTNYTSVPLGSALANSTWSATTGTSYGQDGRAISFTPTNESVSLTVTDPYTSTLHTSTYAKFNDVDPTVGEDAFDTIGTITVEIGTPSDVSSVNITMLDNGKLNSYYNLTGSDEEVEFYPFEFQMTDRWVLQLHYTAKGHSGGSYVYVDLEWETDTGGEHSNDTKYDFSNSDNQHQDTWNLLMNMMALGQWVFGTETVFSPSQVNFTDVRNFGDGYYYDYDDNAAASAEPTLDSYNWTHYWTAGSDYNMTDKACDKYNYCSTASIEIFSKTNLTISDTAPVVGKPTVLPTGGVPGQPIDFSVNVTSNVPQNESSVTWQFGDDYYASESNVNAVSTTSHVYQFASKYAVVVYASSPFGETSANWAWVTIDNTPNEPSVRISNSTPAVGVPVQFNASYTRENGQLGLGNLSFSWAFGDGAIANGYGLAGSEVTHAYATTGEKTITLTIQNRDGVTTTVTRYLNVTSGAPAFTFPGRTITVDTLALFKPAGLAGLSTSPITETWNWGDGNETVGYNPGHTYTRPGNYTASLTLSGGAYGSGVTHTGTIVVKDDPLTIVLPYNGAVIYGENHTSNFTAEVLGSYADSEASLYSSSYGPGHSGDFNFTFLWGDGNTSSASVTTNLTTKGHVYADSSQLALNVTVTSPFRAEWQSSGYGVVTVESVPDWDGDGVPNAYEVAITNTSIAQSSTSEHISVHNGTGFTDYVGPYLAALGNLSADPDSDGLTTEQEITGSVTGFVSDPLDANTAGDGIPDGSHFFSNSYPNDNQTTFGPTSSNQTNISGVDYAGPAISFHSASILVQVNLSAGTIGGAEIQLAGPSTAPGVPGGWVTLGTMSANSQTFQLVNSTPTGGEVDYYNGISLANFQIPATWHVRALDGSVTGTILEANLALSYYTDPSLADPTHQGLLQGHGITTAILNCSEPENANYTAFNENSLTLTKVDYFPYTEEYYKLSKEQGIPYILGMSGSVDHQNWVAFNNSTEDSPEQSNCSAKGVITSLFKDTASYLGDADFGISPWVSDYTGDYQPNDEPLTNGMKALGAAAYDSTINHYYNAYTGASTLAAYTGYIYDSLTYQKALNPTVLSTQYSGANDGYAQGLATPEGTTPLAAAVEIYNATDLNCYYANFVPLPSGPEEQVSVTTSAPGSPTIFTPTQNATNSYPYCKSGFTFDDKYTLPLNDSQSTFTVTMALWHSQDAGNLTKAIYTTAAISVANGSGLSKRTVCEATPSWLPNSGGCITFSVTVAPTSRATTVLANNTGELETLAGYGTRYVGEEQFYAFYLNVTGSASGHYPKNPFAVGGSLNTLLVSRATFLETNFSADLNGSDLSSRNPALQTCFNGANITTRSGAGSQLAVAGVLSATVNDTCANELLANLIAYNSTGNITGSWQRLNTTQVQLLGLNIQAAQLALFLPIPGANSPMGPQPQAFGSVGFFSLVGSDLVAVGNFYHIPMLIALGKGFILLQAALVKVGQTILGALSAIESAYDSAVSFAVKVFSVLYAVFVALFNEVLSTIENDLENLGQTIGTSEAKPILSEAVVDGYVTSTDYTAIFGSQYESSGANSSENAQLEVGLAIAGALVALNIAVMVIGAALSGGSLLTALKAFASVATKDVTKFVVNLLISTLAVVASSVIGLVISSPTLAWEDLGLRPGTLYLAIVGSLLPFIIDTPEFSSSVKAINAGGDLTRVSVGPVINLIGDISAFGLLIAENTLALNSTMKFIFAVVAMAFAALGFWAGFPQTPAGKATSQALSPQPVTVIAQAASAAIVASSAASALCIALNSDC